MKKIKIVFTCKIHFIVTMNEDRIRKELEASEAFLVIEHVKKRLDDIPSGSPFMLRERYIKPERKLYQLILFNDSGYTTHGFISFKDTETLPTMEKTPFYGKMINEPVRIVMKVFTCPPAEKKASEYKEFYVFGGNNDKPGFRHRQKIAQMCLPDRIKQYLTGNHGDLSKSEMKMCTHLIVLIIRASAERELLSEKYLQLETKWITHRTEDKEAHSIHVKNLKSLLNKPRDGELPERINVVGDEIASVLRVVSI